MKKIKILALACALPTIMALAYSLRVGEFVINGIEHPMWVAGFLFGLGVECLLLGAALLIDAVTNSE